MRCPKCNGYMAYTEKGWYCEKCKCYPERERNDPALIFPTMDNVEYQIEDEHYSCPMCQHNLKPTANFCPSCGAKVSEYIQTIKKERMLAAQQNMQFKIQMANLKMQQEQLRIQQQQYDSMVKCPRCGSTSITGQKKGYGVVKGGLGALALGGISPAAAVIGLGAGNIGRKKINCTCMKCGYKFKAGAGR